MRWPGACASAWPGVERAAGSAGLESLQAPDLVESDRRDDVVYMWMQSHVLGPALVEAEESASVEGATVGIGEQLGQSRGAAAHEQLDGLPVAAHDRAQEIRQGKGDHEVGHRQQTLKLSGHPISRIGRAAARAQAVIAAVVGVVSVAAIAGIAVPAQGRDTALEDGLEGPAFVQGDRGGVARPEPGREALDHPRHREGGGGGFAGTAVLPGIGHLSGSEWGATRASTCPMASAWLIGVRWV